MRAFLNSSPPSFWIGDLALEQHDPVHQVRERPKRPVTAYATLTSACGNEYQRTTDWGVGQRLTSGNTDLPQATRSSWRRERDNTPDE